MSSAQRRYDVVVVGGGHNGLVATAYLARAGLAVLVLERLGHTGGAVVSTQAFAGHPARVSRYSYLVGLMPQALLADLDLRVELRSRRFASYTPWLRDGRYGGLLVERPEGAATRFAMRDLTGGSEEYHAWCDFYRRVRGLAGVVAPTLLEPLPLEREIRARVDQGVWDDFVTRPVGEVIERSFSDDTVRGIVATDAMVGTFASPHCKSLAQNRALLYHLLGNGSGEWRVPVGGMGAVSTGVHARSVAAGAEILTGAEVYAVDAVDDAAEVTWRDRAGDHTVGCRFVLGNVAPWTLRDLLGEEPDPATKPEGSQLKITLLLDRLPALRSGVDPAVAFAGTVHVGEEYRRLLAAYDEAAAGRLPQVIPGELTCHSLTDPSVVDGEEPAGVHTLSYFGLCTPASLFERDPLPTRQAAVSRALAGINQHLAEPIETCLAIDSRGNPCIESTFPQDLEADLGMPGGHIYHGDLDWPWAANRAPLDTPARRWGVQTDVGSVLVCGAGARRGGGVSGIGGHNAAQAVLESR